MEKQTEVFKVVTTINCNLVSAAQREEYQVTYIPQIWVKPKIGKIFAFESQKTAAKFIRTHLFGYDRVFQIWKAVGKNVSKLDFMACSLNTKWFWDGDQPNEHFDPTLRLNTPKGTIGVGSIKLLEKVA